MCFAIIFSGILPFAYIRNHLIIISVEPYILKYWFQIFFSSAAVKKIAQTFGQNDRFC